LLPPTDGRPSVETGVDLSALRQDLAVLRGDVGALAQRVENANSTLQRAGESLVAIQQDLRELRGEIDETTAFRSDLAKIRDVVSRLNLTDQARADLRAKLLSDLEYEGKLKDAVEGKNLDAAKAALKNLVDRIIP
ncbi:MAG: hypothetical protein L0211_02320, partial [Planctomycetaceae bacterium]|nr:hypothetical protein [Planctomycetaceae bacterium]